MIDKPSIVERLAKAAVNAHPGMGWGNFDEKARQQVRGAVGAVVADTIEVLQARLAAVENALEDIAGGRIGATGPDVMTMTPEDFRAAMWSWSQERARTALKEKP